MMSHLRRALGFLLLLGFFTFPLGCEAMSVAKKAFPDKIKAEYEGLKGQSVGVMVWADRGIRIDYPSVQLDAATGVQNKLEAAQKEKVADLEGTTFPVKPASIVRYQMDNPQIETMKLTDVAPHLGVKRLIYVEITDFATRPHPGVELYRGSITGSIRAVEIAPDKTAKVVYEENDVHAIFPKKSPEDGVLMGDDYRMYVGVIDAFSNEVTKRFVEHEEEK